MVGDGRREPGTTLIIIGDLAAFARRLIFEADSALEPTAARFRADTGFSVHRNDITRRPGVVFGFCCRGDRKGRRYGI